MDSFCRFEQQRAKITISKLQCEPFEDKSLKTIVGNLNDTVFGMKSSTDERMEQIETNLDEKFGKSLKTIVGKLNDTVFGMKSYTDKRMKHIETNLDEYFGNLEEHLEENIEKLEDASFPFISPFHCPTSKSNSFQLVENVCYYFESQSSLPYRNAQQNCKIVFGLHGHLFEPDTPEKSRQIYNLASSITYGSHWWVGVHSIVSYPNFDNPYTDEHEHFYASSGQSLTMTAEGYGGLNSANKCVYLHNYEGTATEYDCNEGFYSICESKNVKQE